MQIFYDGFSHGNPGGKLQSTSQRQTQPSHGTPCPARRWPKETQACSGNPGNAVFQGRKPHACRRRSLFYPALKKDNSRCKTELQAEW